MTLKKKKKKKKKPFSVGRLFTVGRTWTIKQFIFFGLRAGEYEKLPEKVSKESYQPLGFGNMKNFLKRWAKKATNH